MEILGRSSAVANLNISLGAKLQKTLHAPTGMLRTLPFESVRQQENQATWLIPLYFGGNDELIDDNLRAIHEIAELRFPHDQGQRIGHAVTKLEAHDGVLAQQAIDSFESHLIRDKMLERNVGFTGFVIREFKMPLSKCAARNVLAA